MSDDATQRLAAMRDRSERLVVERALMADNEAHPHEWIRDARTDLDALRGAVEDVLVFLSQYDSANSLRCGVCSGHSPSWDGHFGCATAATDRLRAAITARLGGA